MMKKKYSGLLQLFSNIYKITINMLIYLIGIINQIIFEKGTESRGVLGGEDSFDQFPEFSWVILFLVIALPKYNFREIFYSC